MTDFFAINANDKEEDVIETLHETFDKGRNG